MSEVPLWITVLKGACEAGEAGVPVPPMDRLFQRPAIRDLWLSHYLSLRGDLVEGHGRLFITEKGKKLVSSYKEDWPVDAKVASLGLALRRLETQA